MSPNDSRTRRSITRINSRSMLEQAIRRSDLREIEISWPDHRGHARGRRLPANAFSGRVLDAGVKLEDGTFTRSDAATPTEASALAVPDSVTFRRLPWREATGHVIADIVDRDREIVPTAPRSVLHRVVDGLRARGLSASIRVTLEGYVLDEHGRPLPGEGRRDSLVEANRLTSLLEPLTSGLTGFVPVAGAATADGPGQFAITLADASPVEAADDVFRLVYALGELGRRTGTAVTLVPPADAETLPPATMHLQVAVWSDDQPVFGWGAHAAAGVAQRVADSVRAHLPALTLFGAPSRASYARDGESAHGIDPVTWEADPSSVDDVPLHEWPAAARIGLRVAADAEPHWAVAALLAAVSLGLDPDRPVPSPVTAPPASLADAVDAASEDTALIAILGRDAVAAYASRLQTDWFRTADAAPRVGAVDEGRPAG